MRATIPAETKRSYRAVHIPLLKVDLTLNQMIIGLGLLGFGGKLYDRIHAGPIVKAMVIGTYAVVAGAMLIGHWPLFDATADSFVVWGRRIVMYIMRPRRWRYF